MMVRFTTTCDYPACGKRALEYEAWPTCEECGNDTCPEHMREMRKEADVDQQETCVCFACDPVEAFS